MGFVGSFDHQFNTAGEFFYWSDYVDTNRLVIMRGKIVVTAKASIAANLTVSIADQVADLNAGSGVTVSDTSSCTGVTTSITGCTDSFSTSGYDFEYGYEICSTPQVDAQSVTQGYMDTDIVFTGDGEL